MNRWWAAFVALVLSVPLAVLGLAISDSTSTPDWVRWLISPGYFWTVTHPGPGFNLVGDVGGGLLINLAYYSVILFACVAPLLKRFQLPKSDKFWMKD